MLSVVSNDIGLSLSQSSFFPLLSKEAVAKALWNRFSEARMSNDIRDWEELSSLEHGQTFHLETSAGYLVVGFRPTYPDADEGQYSIKLYGSDGVTFEDIGAVGERSFKLLQNDLSIVDLFKSQLESPIFELHHPNVDWFHGARRESLMLTAAYSELAMYFERIMQPMPSFKPAPEDRASDRYKATFSYNDLSEFDTPTMRELSIEGATAKRLFWQAMHCYRRHRSALIEEIDDQR